MKKHQRFHTVIWKEYTHILLDILTANLARAVRVSSDRHG